MATKIILDPGHGGYDSGASYEGRREKDDVLNLAFDVAANLRRLGYEVEFTRVDDVYDSPTEKARIGNASGADYFVSLHRNSSPNPNRLEGVQTLVYSDTGIKAEMARNINRRLEDVGFRNINVEERKDLAVLRRTNMPALLVEVGFINNEKDNLLFDSKRAEIAEAIAMGIDEALTGGTASAAFSEKVDDTPMLEGDDEYSFLNDFHGYKTQMPVFAQDEMTEVNDGENQSNSIMEQEQTWDETVIYQILISVYRNLGMASRAMNQLINSGFDATANQVDGLYQVRVGAFDTIDDALKVQGQLRNRGYESLIVTYQEQNIM